MNRIIAIVYPQTHEVGCVLQQVFGGDKRVCNMFSVDSWRTSGFEGHVYAEGTMEEWIKLASIWQNRPQETIEQKVKNAENLKQYFFKNQSKIRKINDKPVINVSDLIEYYLTHN